jgi:hypothetical protein
MHAFARASLIFCVLACASPAAHAQQPQQQQGGVVSGRVTLDGKTSAGVEVVLLTDGNERRAQVAKTLTDAEGRFRLNVETAGRYRVVPVAPAYVASNAESVAKAVTVAPGDEITGTDFALGRGGVITGLISTPEGRPAIAERITVTPVGEPGQNRPVLDLPAAMFETDDRGVYRIFGLPPGRYLVSAGTAGGGGVGAGLRGRRLSYTRTFHPNVTEEARATAVEVAAGGEASNIDIAMSRRAENFTASGRIVDARSNQPFAGVAVGYGATRENGRMAGAPALDLRADAKGEFTIENLTPGRYVAFVVSNNDSAAYSEPLPFEVTNADVTGLELKAEQGSSVSGALVVEGASDASLIRRLAGIPLGNFLYQTDMLWATREMPVVNPDGSFRLNGLRPGKLRIATNTQRITRGFSPLRVERDGIAQPDGIDIPQGATHITGVRVVLAYGNGIVRGQAKVKDGELPPGTRLFVLARRTGMDATAAFTAPAEVDARGNFALEWLAAGEYDLVLGARQPGAASGDMRLSAARRRVRVTDNSTSDVTLVFESGAGAEP